MKNLKIPFNIPYVAGKEIEFISQAIVERDLSGGNYFSTKCEQWLSHYTGCNKVLLTASCTQALEFSALLLDIKEGDEIIMPSFTFVSSANPFVLRGARIVFVDIDPLSMNINADLVEDAITHKTKVILAMHYGGVACDMAKIMELAQKHHLFVVEDAAHCMGAFDEGGSHLGSIGDIGVLSFHATKNIQCGEGGAILINNTLFEERADYLRDKGTDRIDFLKGKIKNYTWVSIGSNFWLNELAAAFLWAQLLETDKINSIRKLRWTHYHHSFSEEYGLDTIPDQLNHNAHIFFLKCRNMEERWILMRFLGDQGIQTATHYEPLHQSSFGKKAGRFHGLDNHTSSESKRLLKLPLYPELSLESINSIERAIVEFYKHLAVCL